MNIRFSTQQRRTMELLAEGYCYKEIARAMEVSAETVSGHVERCAKKAGVSGRKLIVYAVRWADAQKGQQ